jgi:hypothetical protein
MAGPLKCRATIAGASIQGSAVITRGGRGRMHSVEAVAVAVSAW